MPNAQNELQGDPARRAADECTSFESLARETSTSPNLVQAIYIEERQALEANATIRTFVGLLAMRRTRLILQNLGSRDLTAAEVH